MSTGTLYQFVASVWANAPKIAVTELGYTGNAIKQESVDLLHGQNFDPNGFLKVNPKGTVPTLVLASGGPNLTDSVTVVQKLLELAPNPPPKVASQAELDALVTNIHSEAHDPNTMFLLPINEEDRQAKLASVPGPFLAGRQEALDKYAPAAPEQFKAFLDEKQKANGGLLAVLNGEADSAPIFQIANAQWKSAGDFIRGDVTKTLAKTPGRFLGGAQRPGEADFHLITWLARQVTNSGVPPNQPANVAIHALAQKTGGGAIDPVVSAYWDSWVTRPSFAENGVH